MRHSDLALYKNIKDRRTALGMTQADLAKKVGYADKSMISRIEQGKIDLTSTKISEIAEALHTTPSALLGPAEERDVCAVLIEKIKSSDDRTVRRLSAYLDFLQKEDLDS